MADENKLEFVTVKAAKEDGRVALYENHSANVTKDNPDGEVYVVGDGKAHKVARTPTVEQKLRDGELVETSETPKPPVMAQREATPKPAAPAVHVENIGRSTGKG